MAGGSQLSHRSQPLGGAYSWSFAVTEPSPGGARTAALGAEWWWGGGFLSRIRFRNGIWACHMHASRAARTGPHRPPRANAAQRRNFK